MPTQLSSYKVVNNVKQDIIEGTLYNGIIDFSFLSGETEKYILLEIPEFLTVQFVGQGLTFKSHFDNTFALRLIGDVTTLTTGTSIIERNLNRNVTDIPLADFSINPIGTYGGEGTVLEDFDPFIRQKDYPNASKTIKDGVERIFKHDQNYLFKFTRATDTLQLDMEYRFLWIEG